jgi:hypothetical protein
MKKLWISRLLLLLFVSLVVVSCGSDDADNGPTVLLPKLDGFYVYGTNTIAAGPSEPASRMVLAILDKSKTPKIESKEGIFGKFMYIGANSTISFAKVEGDKGTIYGADKGGAISNGLTIENVPVDDMVVNGTLVENAEAIKVATEGLYYVFVDTNTGAFVFMPIKPSMIGPATPKGWEAGTKLNLKSTAKDKTVFEASIPLKGADGYRYKLNDGGWHAYQKVDQITTLSSLGVPDYGVAWETGVNDVGIQISDMPNKEPGVYTVTLTYTAATNDWEEVKTKTGELPVDYANFSVGILGDATEGGDFNGNGNGYEIKKPSKSGDVFTWTWDNVAFIQDKEFIFLKDAKWDSGLQLDYEGATVGGDAITAGDIINAKAAPVNSKFANFHVINAGTYDVKLEINGKTNAKTVTITQNK